MERDIFLLIIGFFFGLGTGYGTFNFQARERNRVLYEQAKMLQEIGQYLQEQNDVFRLFHRWHGWEERDVQEAPEGSGQLSSRDDSDKTQCQTDAGTVELIQSD